MKKFFLIFIVFSMLLLPACGQRVKSLQPTISDPVLDDWNFMYWVGQDGGTYSITHQQAYSDSETVTCDYDGAQFTISDHKGARSYSYLVLDEVLESTDGGYLQHFYMLLSNDAEMTYERYRDYVNNFSFFARLTFPSTELVFTYSLPLDSAEVFGVVPDGIHQILSTAKEYTQIYCQKDSFFFGSLQQVPYYVDDNPTGTTLPVYSLYRYGYDGQQICRVSLLDGLEQVTELRDGGFAVVTSGSYNSAQILLCYNADGTLRSETPLESSDIAALIEVDNTLYCLGTVIRQENEDLYFAKFSLYGNLLSACTAGGSDNDRLHAVIPTQNGFTLYGFTQSQDGDLPLAQTGSAIIGSEFQAELSYDLEFFNAETVPDGTSYLNQVGYAQDTAVFKNDPLLLPNSSDRLPTSGLTVRGIYPWEDGYIILRTYGLEKYPFSPTSMSRRQVYNQLIATGYDANGTALWQTITTPFVT